VRRRLFFNLYPLFCSANCNLTTNPLEVQIPFRRGVNE
jgi:hypothetical protein